MSAHGQEPDLDRLAERLESERPVPGAEFREQLRARVVESRGHARRRVQLLAAAYAACGLVLLAIAAIGLGGAGPFAAG